MVAVTTKKLSASSLVETIIALTIAAFLFSLVTIIFVQVTSSSSSIKKIRAHELLKNYLSETVDRNNFTNEDVKAEDFILKKRVSETDSFPGVIKLRFFIYDENAVLVEQVETLMENQK